MTVSKSQANTRTVDPVTGEAANVGTKTDGTTKGLEVISENGPVDPRPFIYSMWHSEPFLNGSSPDMNVDGSVTPVVFKRSVPAGKVHYIKRIVFQIDDNGVIGMDEFGSLGSPLTNGLLIKIKIKGIEHVFKNLKNNAMIVMHFAESHHIQNSGGFLSGNFFSGNFAMEPDMTMDGDEGDEITVTVQDDLSSLLHLRMAVSYWHEV